MAAPINPVPQGMFSDDEIDGLCDWYDQALASGQGFQSEEERKKYFDDMGDPLAHPLFAGSTEDLEGCEMVEAFRCLREEDKTPAELAVMYKEEGNEWMKKKVKKDLKEAMIRYTHALHFLDSDDREEKEEPRVTLLEEEEEEGEGDQKEAICNLPPPPCNKNHVLRSQILSNRALAAMHLKNYGTALGDLNMALLVWPGNIKAHFRKCKCLLALTTKRRSELALNAAVAGLQADPNNADIQKLLIMCEKAVATEKRKAQEYADRQVQLEASWQQAWQLATGRGVRLGRPGETWRHPPQLASPLPFYAEEEGVKTKKDLWPVVMLYPQHRQIDVVQGADPSTMLVLLLAEMFPEPEEEGGQQQQQAAVHWDTGREYCVSNLMVFVHVSSCAQFQSCEEWLEYNRWAAKRGTTIENDNEDDFDKVSPVAGGSASSGGGVMGLSEVHLGCTLEQVMRAPGVVLEGGLLSLLVFPRANAAPREVYLKRCGGSKKCGIINPVG